ncbi:glycosyltransferase [Rhodococcus sp. 14-2483-1-2]|uniref:glycosyltransferase n=1 Tax=Rhodococcus sp. 14-2483-1-2 TaxID=2023147 RepID=UPI0011403A8E|nr:glycosyltransferase [Rhodococcus sp. 14-2483-1-2]
MKIAVLTLGTRGDVQPFVQIADSLIGQGHEVTFASPPGMSSLTKALPVSTVEFGPDVSAFLNSPRGQRIILSGRTSTLLRELFLLNNKHSEEIDDVFRELSAGADLLIGGSLAEEKAAAAALAHSIPMTSVHFSPFVKTSLVPHSLFDIGNLGPYTNRRTYDLFTALRSIAALRDTARIPEVPFSQRISHRIIERAGATVVDAYSRHLLPSTESIGDPDSSSRLDPTGFIHMTPHLRSRVFRSVSEADSEGIEQWIASGSGEVVYFGFGSMPVGDPTRLLALIAEVCRALGTRAVWCTGWSPTHTIPVDSRIRVVDEVDHDRIIPLCVTVVHHGGAGTTAMALRHGRPQVITSFFWDQQFWGRMVANKNLGIHLRYRTARAEDLMIAIRYAMSPPVRIRAELLARAAAVEGGLGNTLSKIDAAVRISAVSTRPDSNFLVDTAAAQNCPRHVPQFPDTRADEGPSSHPSSCRAGDVLDAANDRQESDIR